MSYRRPSSIAELAKRGAPGQGRVLVRVIGGRRGPSVTSGVARVWLSFGTPVAGAIAPQRALQSKSDLILSTLS